MDSGLRVAFEQGTELCLFLPRTPLHYAAANCNYQCLFALVGSGASVNDLDERGCTPLHYAAAADTDGTSVMLLSCLWFCVNKRWLELCALFGVVLQGSEPGCCSLDCSLFVVSAGAWNIYREIMQIQGSGTIRATMLCIMPRRTDIASVWSW